VDNRSYYQNLLIVQYSNKTNAKATIGAMYDTVIPKNSVTGNNLLEDIRDAFNLDTAVGVQLDILGYYIGVNRLYQGQDFDTLKLMGFKDYGGYSTATYGFNTYSNYASDMSNGILTYAKMISVSNKLSDNDFRFLLKLKAAQNNCDHSCYAIDEILYAFLKNELFYIENQNMTMTYFVSSSYTKLLPVMIQKGLLLKPMGVGIDSVIKQNTYFGYSSYTGITPEWVTGFSTYSNYDTIEGKELTYKDIIHV
jgi:hypothetical protein